MFVGATGFEPATTWSQTRRATGLRYTPLEDFIIACLYRLTLKTELTETFTSKEVGATGFEPATTWSQTRRATGLRYTPFFDCECKGTNNNRNHQAFGKENCKNL